MITVLYFAGLKEQAGTAEETFDFAGREVQELLAAISHKYDSFSQDVIHIAVNEEYVSPNEVLQEGDVVALIPPVSGG